jgi:hypothetical protein
LVVKSAYLWFQHELSFRDTYGLSCRAAAAALSLGQTHCAVELLECGRGVIWSQYICMRGMVGPSHPVHRDTAITKSDVLDWIEIHHIETRLKEERFLIPPSFQVRLQVLLFIYLIYIVLGQFITIYISVWVKELYLVFI